MAVTITNRASLRYTYGAVTETVASNVASTVVNDPLNMTKTSLETAYRAGEAITYIITVTNGTDAALSNVTIEDDLGAYSVSALQTAVPLTYEGPAQLYSDGVFASELTPAVGQDSVSFTIPSIAPGSTATILYKAVPNEYAPMEPDSAITNTATFTPAAGDPITATYSLPVDTYAAVSIEKEMSPNPVTGGGTIRNTFTILNTGNTEATDLVLSDPFQPALNNLTVSINGTPVAASDYTYVGGVLTLPAEGAATVLSVPAATYTQDPDTGVVSSLPGMTVVTVSGTI
ncbi:MAG: DUF11 domain-containing protein [Clostridia bacterium]|nr:DUF11 domain-containing protein [Clostridia bacterium]